MVLRKTIKDGTASLALALGAVLCASLLRLWPLASLGNTLTWLTYNPAVMFASILGGFMAGLFSAALAILVVWQLWYLLSATPFIVTLGDGLGMGVFVITSVLISTLAEAMRNARAQAQQDKERAEEANRSKTLFLANISHELRTPLNAILGYTQLLQRDRYLLSEHMEKVGIIKKSAENLLGLINQILETSRIETGTLQLDTSPLDLGHLLASTLEQFQPQVRQRGLVLALDLAPAICLQVLGDDGKLRTIFSNLLGNAIKFTQEGSITLSLASTLLPSGALVFNGAVQDTGIGIDPSEHGKLFSLFSQTESGRSSKTGTGLGLHLVKKYLVAMGGSISLDPAYHGGCRFVFSFMLEPTSLTTQQTSATRTVRHLAAGQGQIRVLIADDITDNRQVLMEHLSRAGFSVMGAEDGLEATRLVSTWHPHFLWLDYRMPRLNGLETVRKVRGSSQGQEVRIAGLSANAFQTDRDAMMEAGCDAFLAKPYKISDVFRIMGETLGCTYEYDEDVSAGTVDPRTISLEGLDPVTMAALRRSVDCSDPAGILKALDGCKGISKDLRTYIEFCAQNFEYRMIRELLERVPKEGCHDAE